MPSRKVRTADPSATKPPTHVPSESAEPFFPFARYTGIVGVHTSLLAFTAIFLPTTSPSSLLVQWGTQNPGSDDKPKRNFLEALTENPLRSVAWICAGALILQSWWASWVRSWQDESRRRKTDGAEEMQRRLERNEWKKQRIQVFTQAATMTLAASVLFYVVAILFGAPLLSHPLQTYSVSLLLAVLTVLPPAYTLGPPSFGADSPALVSRLTWVRLFAELSPRTPVERALVYPAVGAATGCWAGAIPIGLDWERPWQAWPLTPAFGAVAGCIVGSLVALMVSATLELAQAGRAQAQHPTRLAPAAGKSKKS